MKDIAVASGAPIGSLYHHFRGGKVQIALEALVNAGAAYGLLIPTIVNEYDDLGAAYFATRGLDPDGARTVTLALIGALAGACVLARTVRSTEPLLAAGHALAPHYRGVALKPASAAAVGPR